MCTTCELYDVSTGYTYTYNQLANTDLHHSARDVLPLIGLQLAQYNGAGLCARLVDSAG